MTAAALFSLSRKTFASLPVISTLEDSTELCSYILSQSLEGEDIFEFLKDMENLNNITADEIYEVANKVLNNPTIHILKSS